eukprot:scaffold59264_cov41-Prasinocladus_malaysianus.AAC.1
MGGLGPRRRPPAAPCRKSVASTIPTKYHIGHDGSGAAPAWHLAYAGAADLLTPNNSVPLLNYPVGI